MPTLLVLVTGPDTGQLAQLASTLVEERLAACGNIIPGLRSIYRWEDKVNDDSEALLLLKTTGARYAELEARIKALHPYDVPEIIAFPVERGLPAYLAWVAESVA
jgi:periplasmic divalent cation tolerance protein